MSLKVWRPLARLIQLGWGRSRGVAEARGAGGGGRARQPWGHAVCAGALAPCWLPWPCRPAAIQRPPPGRTTPTPLPRPSAAGGPCASVQTTRAIDRVPAACAALWAPYGVTKVPPANLTDSTPALPQVVNATNGAVSDPQLGSWIRGSNRASVSYRWAKANKQPALLPRLRSLALYPFVQPHALASNATMEQPDCAIYPLLRRYHCRPTKSVQPL